MRARNRAVFPSPFSRRRTVPGHARAAGRAAALTSAGSSTCRRASAFLETAGFEWEHVCRFIESWFRESRQTGAALRDQLGRNSPHPRIGVESAPARPHLHHLPAPRVAAPTQGRRLPPVRRRAPCRMGRRQNARPAAALHAREQGGPPPPHGVALPPYRAQIHADATSWWESNRRLFLPMIRLKPDDAEAILDEISAHHGLLKDFGNSWYGFHHFTLQEHFSMEHITSPAAPGRSRGVAQQGLVAGGCCALYAGKGDCTELVCMLARQREDVFQSNLFPHRRMPRGGLARSSRRAAVHARRTEPHGQAHSAAHGHPRAGGRSARHAPFTGRRRRPRAMASR